MEGGYGFVLAWILVLVLLLIILCWTGVFKSNFVTKSITNPTKMRKYQDFKL